MKYGKVDSSSPHSFSYLLIFSLLFNYSWFLSNLLVFTNIIIYSYSKFTLLFSTSASHTLLWTLWLTTWQYALWIVLYFLIVAINMVANWASSIEALPALGAMSAFHMYHIYFPISADQARMVQLPMLYNYFLLCFFTHLSLSPVLVSLYFL